MGLAPIMSEESCSRDPSISYAAVRMTDRVDTTSALFCTKTNVCGKMISNLDVFMVMGLKPGSVFENNLAVKFNY
jgi:hypothetical protein